MSDQIPIIPKRPRKLNQETNHTIEEQVSLSSDLKGSATEIEHLDGSARENELHATSDSPLTSDKVENLQEAPANEEASKPSSSIPIIPSRPHKKIEQTNNDGSEGFVDDVKLEEADETKKEANDESTTSLVDLYTKASNDSEANELESAETVDKNEPVGSTIEEISKTERAETVNDSSQLVDQKFEKINEHKIEDEPKEEETEQSEGGIEPENTTTQPDSVKEPKEVITQPEAVEVPEDVKDLEDEQPKVQHSSEKLEQFEQVENEAEEPRISNEQSNEEKFQEQLSDKTVSEPVSESVANDLAEGKEHFTPEIVSPGINDGSSGKKIPSIPSRPKKKEKEDDPKPVPSIPSRPKKKPLAQTGEIKHSQSEEPTSKLEESTKAKAPPPKPKKLSSKIAAFQQMFNQEPEIPPKPEAQRSERPKPVSFGSKLSSDKMKFAESLKGVMGKGIALPGMARVPEPKETDSTSSSVSKSQDEDLSVQPISQARRAKGPKGKRLPKFLKEPVKVESEPRFTLVTHDLWDINFSKSEKVQQEVFTDESNERLPEKSVKSTQEIKSISESNTPGVKETELDNNEQTAPKIGSPAIEETEIGDNEQEEEKPVSEKESPVVDRTELAIDEQESLAQAHDKTSSSRDELHVNAKGPLDIDVSKVVLSSVDQLEAETKTEDED